MTVGKRPCCPDCGAQLRQGRPAGQRCDPCQRGGPAITLPEGFYDRPVLDAALAQLAFGPVFRAVRGALDCSQQTLAESLGWEQSRVSAIETGQRPLVTLRDVVRVANTLAIPAGKLGFRHGVTLDVGTTTGRTRDSWVQRRNFVNHVAGLTLGLSAAVGLDLDRLTALLPQAEPTGTRHLGDADVEAIEHATAEYARKDFAQGSGLVRDTALAHLRATLPLLGAQMASEVRPRFFLATARLATQTGYMSFDVQDDEAARRLWLIGLDLARAAEHPLAADQTVFVLYDLALQAVALGRPDEALRLVHLGQVAAIGAHPAAGATMSCLASIQAIAHAAHGDATGCERALGHAEDHFAAADPSQESWADFLVFNHAQLASYQGRAHYALAQTSHEPRAANRAVARLRQAVDGFHPGHAVSRVLRLPDLAGAHALAGDVDTAVSVGHQAIDAVTALHSLRAYGGLQVLHTVLEPVRTSPGVAELRDRLTAATA